MRTVLCVFFVSLSISAQTPLRPPQMADTGANLPAQKIGFNDLIAVSVYDSPELTRTVRVGADGRIRLPMLHQALEVVGCMPSELESLIAAALKQELILVEPLVTVTIAGYHSRPVSVMGAVKMPVTFQAETPVSLLEALARAGGLSPDAGLEVLVSRPQQGTDGSAATLTQRISLRSLIDKADPEVNLRLTGGEEVRVPEAGKVYVVGNVKKPGGFTVRDSAETTVLKALAQSEGLLPYAGKQAYIYRREGGPGGASSEIPIELKQIMDRKSPDVPLLANDILYVPDRAGRRAGMAALEKLLLFAGGAATAVIYTTVRP
jgi:polysaccharide export outer membrane protein